MKLNSIIIIITVLLLSCEQSKGEMKIERLDQYTKIDSNHLTEIYLIINPPSDSAEMIELLDVYHKKDGRLDRYDSQKRLYIQVRDFNVVEQTLLDKVTELPKSASDLRNEDFLAKYFWYSTTEGHKKCRRTIYYDRW